MKELKKLIDLKSIITILITGCLIYGFVVGKVNNEQFMTIATMIFTFYFAKRETKEEIQDIIEKNNIIEESGKQTNIEKELG